MQFVQCRLMRRTFLYTDLLDVFGLHMHRACQHVSGDCGCGLPVGMMHHEAEYELAHQAAHLDRSTPGDLAIVHAIAIDACLLLMPQQRTRSMARPVTWCNVACRCAKQACPPEAWCQAYHDLPFVEQTA